ncbi:hypothetical protein BHE90_017571 [Fusarium euwallaceae]|uniref:Uncharacterized protein n=1 Tax=Fusarium euwallaceae TaxID=1147111 RepID=A0A430KX72_9HYPO|nr:hypothetical protein BHE90_017571 [Fusarium euwallaceae]
MIPSPPSSSSSSMTMDWDEQERADTRTESETELRGPEGSVLFCSPTLLRRALGHQLRCWLSEEDSEPVQIGTEWIDDQGVLHFRNSTEIEMGLALLRVNPTAAAAVDLLALLSTGRCGDVAVRLGGLLTTFMAWAIIWMAEYPRGVDVLDPRVLADRCSEVLTAGDGRIAMGDVDDWVESIPVVTMTVPQWRRECGQHDFAMFWVMAHQWLHEKTCSLLDRRMHAVQRDVGQYLEVLHDVSGSDRTEEDEVSVS